MATRNDGVCRYDGKAIECFGEKAGIPTGVTIYNGKSFAPFPTAGLRNNQIWTMIEDDKGGIWLGTREFGLFRYDGKSFTEFAER